MRKERICFLIAAFSLTGFIVCLTLFLFTDNIKGEINAVPKGVVEENMIDEKGAEAPLIKEEEEKDSENAGIEKEAQEEIQRFKATYDVDIPMEDMIQQIRIRADYEEKYGNSYDLEDVFLISRPSGSQVGDDGCDEIFDMLDEIEKYVKKFGIDEACYESMSIEDELTAIKQEYGELDTEMKD